MSTQGTIRMALSPARKLAEKIVAELAINCDRIEIAGSIRRSRAECGDIDLVCVPKPGGKAHIIERCQRAGDLLKHGEQYCVFVLRNGFQLDLWFAHNGGGDLFAPEPPNFGVLLLARTGSAMHNVWIAQQAQARGLHFNPHKGILRGREVIASTEEADIFAALQLGFVAPERRER
jgi:DNA polymerase/3'-5' exonuclease PolX